MILAVTSLLVSSQHGPKLTPSNTFLGGKSQQKTKQLIMSSTSLPLAFFIAQSRVSIHDRSTPKIKSEFPSRYADYVSA